MAERYWHCPSCGYGIIPVTGGPSPNFLCPPCRAKAAQTERDEARRAYDREERRDR